MCSIAMRAYSRSMRAAWSLQQKLKNREVTGREERGDRTGKGAGSLLAG
jgi:hypothetical protein